MTIDPVKIPQNVYVEEQIIGPITLRQIFLLLGGGGVSYALWALMKQAGEVSWIATALAWIPFAIAAMFAFVKINDISLFRLCMLLIERMEKPNIRTWTPRQGITINIRTTPEKRSKAENEPVHKVAENRITEISSVLDRGPEDAQREASETSLPVRKERIAVDPLRGDQTTKDVSPGSTNTSVEESGHDNFMALLHDIIPPTPHS